jgi:hypothetical protein
MSPEQSAGQSQPQKRQRKSGIFEAVKQFFAERNNEWATFVDIETATGVKKVSVRQIVYKSHSDQFERDSQPGAGRETRIRMKE